MYENLAILAAFAFIYSITSGGLERTPLSGALVFAAFGFCFGPYGLGFLDMEVDSEGLRTIAELTLALVLFTDAANADLEVLRQSFRIPQRLLLIGLPLTILSGFVVGLFLFGNLTLLEIAILATMLAPTDAALGKAVVTNKSVPAYIREGLNVESGLNDGICVPILFVFLGLAIDMKVEGGATMLALELVAQQIGIGLAVGIGLTLAGAWLLKRFGEWGWITETWRQLPVVTLAAACFALAQSLGGSGFIAAFVGGLFFGKVAGRHKHAFLLAAEGTGDTLALITWVVFGAVVVGKLVASFHWEVALYAVFSLTLIRMLPVVLSLTGVGLSVDEKLFTAWFGPRGLASIVFAVIVLDRHLPGGRTMVITVACTVILSVIAHGLSANILISALSSRQKGKAKDASRMP